MAKKLTPFIPFVEASQTGGKQRPSLIVLRNSMTSSTKGSALAIAHYWNRSNALESCHYVLDVAQTYQCVPDRVASMPRSYGPPGSIVINLCGEPTDGQLIWDDAEHSKIVSKTADLVAHLVVWHRINLCLVDALQDHEWSRSSRWMKRFRGGILVDVQGEWPSNQFLADVQRQVSRIKKS